MSIGNGRRIPLPARRGDSDTKKPETGPLLGLFRLSSFLLHLGFRSQFCIPVCLPPANTPTSHVLGSNGKPVHSSQLNRGQKEGTRPFLTRVIRKDFQKLLQ